MEIVGTVFLKTLSIFQTELTIFGYTFSYWEVLVFSVVSSLACWLVGTLLFGR